MNKNRDVILYAMIFFLIGVLIILFATNSPEPAGNQKSSIPALIIVKWLIVVVFFLFIGFLLLKQSKILLTNRLNKNNIQIRIHGTKMLGPNKSLFIIETLGHILLLGVTNHHISILLDLKHNDLQEQYKKLIDEKVNKDTNFQPLLSKWLQKVK